MQTELELNKRKLTQSQRVLNFLKQRGLEGVKNYEFAEMHILSHTKRLSELYAKGHNIKKDYLGHGVFKYTLIPESDFGEIQ